MRAGVLPAGASAAAIAGGQRHLAHPERHREPRRARRARPLAQWCATLTPILTTMSRPRPLPSCYFTSVCPLFSFMLSALSPMLLHWDTWTAFGHSTSTLTPLTRCTSVVLICITPRAAWHNINILYIRLFPLHTHVGPLRRRIRRLHDILIVLCLINIFISLS